MVCRRSLNNSALITDTLLIIIVLVLKGPCLPWLKIGVLSLLYPILSRWRSAPVLRLASRETCPVVCFAGVVTVIALFTSLSRATTFCRAAAPLALGLLARTNAFPFIVLTTVRCRLLLQATRKPRLTVVTCSVTLLVSIASTSPTRSSCIVTKDLVLRKWGKNKNVWLLTCLLPSTKSLISCAMASLIALGLIFNRWVVVGIIPLWGK